ncbi:MAG: sporulation integral membrane protein YtvI [Ruminococcaceae bacterium]|nr:sporulation integral membrane protein YtvI [Oscillospiraceae bacterium]
MSKLPLEKHFRFVFLLFYIILGCVVAYFFFAKLFGWFLPFLLAVLFAWMAEPLVKFLEKKVRFPRKLASIVSILVVISLIVLILYLVGKRLVTEISSLAEYMPYLMDRFPDAFNTIEEKLDLLNHYANNFGVDMALEHLIGNALENLSGILTSLTTAAGSFAYKAVKQLPSFFISIIVCLIATYFMSSDKEKILRFINRQITDKWQKRVKEIKGYLTSAFFKYVKAQLILMTITFGELLIAFVIIGIKSPFILAIVVAIVDMLPILGTGTVLIPWALCSVLLSNYALAFELIVIYVICLIVRQIMEPKIVSGQIGIHPLLTLFALYIGLKLLGIFGMLLGVVVLILIINLHHSGAIKLWK